MCSAILKSTREHFLDFRVGSVRRNANLQEAVRATDGLQYLKRKRPCSRTYQRRRCLGRVHL